MSDFSALTTEWAERNKVEPGVFLKTLQSFCDCGDVEPKPEHFLALLMIARELDLNPLLKQIGLMANRGKLSVVVAVDGWNCILQRQPTYLRHQVEIVWKGERFQSEILAAEFLLWRKDHIAAGIKEPWRHVELFEEVYVPPRKKRDGTGEVRGPWQSHPHRLMTWKALSQGTREAYGIGGIPDPDEAWRASEMEDDARPLVAPAPAVALQTLHLSPEQKQTIARGLPTADGRPVIDMSDVASRVLESSEIRGTPGKEKGDAVGAVRSAAPDLAGVETTCGAPCPTKSHHVEPAAAEQRLGGVADPPNAAPSSEGDGTVPSEGVAAAARPKRTGKPKAPAPAASAPENSQPVAAPAAAPDPATPMQVTREVLGLDKTEAFLRGPAPNSPIDASPEAWARAFPGVAPAKTPPAASPTAPAGETMGDSFKRMREKHGVVGGAAVPGTANETQRTGPVATTPTGGPPPAPSEWKIGQRVHDQTDHARVGTLSMVRPAPNLFTEVRWDGGGFLKYQGSAEEIVERHVDPPTIAPATLPRESVPTTAPRRGRDPSTPSMRPQANDVGTPELVGPEPSYGNESEESRGLFSDMED